MSYQGKIKDVFDKSTCVFNKAEVDSALDRMAGEMKAKLQDENPIFICILLGGVVPLGNLLPRLDFQLEINYLQVSSYGTGTTAGELRWIAKPTVSLANRTIVIVDDILDTGTTLRAAIDYCKQNGAAKVYTAVLLNKQKTRKSGGIEQADFAALTMDDRFVFGYGLDYAEFLRNAPGIYAVAKEHQ